MHAAAPQQDGVLSFQPVVLGQAGGDGGNLFRLAEDDKKTHLKAPEEAVFHVKRADKLIELKSRLMRWRQRRVRLRIDLIHLALITMVESLELYQQTWCKKPDRSHKNDQQENRNPLPWLQ
jgi:hypothetical protein